MSGAGEAEAVLRRSGVLGADCGATAGARSGAPVLRWSRHTASGPRSYLRLRHRARTTPSLALDMSYFMHPSTHTPVQVLLSIAYLKLKMIFAPNNLK